MLCELKQTVPLLEWELTPAEIRIGWGEPPSWVVETGTPMFDAVAKLVSNQNLSVSCLTTG